MHPRFVFVSIIAALLTSALSAQDSKIGSALLAQMQTADSHRVFIRFHESEPLQLPNSLSKTEKVHRVFLQLTNERQARATSTKAYLQTRHIQYKDFLLAPAISSVLTNTQILELADFAEVVMITRNDPYAVAEYTVDAEQVDFRDPNEPEWGILKIQADSVWSLGYTGQGAVVAGQDTGYDWTHPALQPKYRGYDNISGAVDHNYNWHDAIHEISPLHNDSIVAETNNPCGLNITSPCDDVNHGTHTMGTMVGTDTLYQMGVAPDAKWIGCRNMERGYGSLYTYLEGFEWMLAPTDLNGENPRPDLAPDVINNSWACPDMEGCNPDNFAILEAVIHNLTQAGIVVVASAGNSGPDCETITTPAAIFEESFTVGASNQVDTLAGFSSRGSVAIDGSYRQKPNVTAPGTGVRSTVRNGGYAVYSGTSMAGPHVAGAVALLISANPNLRGNVELITSILQSTATPLTWDEECNASDIPNLLYGYGRINLLKAVELALTQSGIEPLKESKTVIVNAVPNPVTDAFALDINTEEVVSVQLLGLDGQIIRTWSTPITEMSLDGIQSGIYILKVKFKNNYLATAKILKL